MVTKIVLASKKSKRIWTNKACLKIGKMKIIEIIAVKFKIIFDEINFVCKYKIFEK